MISNRDMRAECWECVNRRAIAGNAHISCADPDIHMKGKAHGIRNGWFYYPLNFDPVWKDKLCDNFKSEKESSGE